jgi:polyisoprenoid-binding protein YceI
MPPHRIRTFLAAGLAVGVWTACSSSDDASSATLDTTAIAAADTEGSANGSVAVAGNRFVVAASGNEARYRVREQLLGVDFPNDAVGKTADVTGGISFDDKGRIIASESRFVIDAATFVSDKDRRDGYVRNRLLESEQHPSIVFVPKEIRGLTLPAASGSHSFQLVGDLTVRNVTRPTTWQVTANVAGDTVSGNAGTKFTFEDFSMEKPRVRSVLSVEDTVALEYDFRLEQR